ncbi:MAG: DUF2064 domain-containing protein [Eggerthellaceae bacterium]|nr:DUF2064 domain-containing protein [Eggerthellaceae bacterium]
MKKHALLIFSKPPLPGLVKTRMTTEYGGFLNPAQAADFYQRCFYDVSEMAMHALIELQRENDALVAADPEAEAVTYDFVVSTTPAESVDSMRELFDKIGPWPMDIHYMSDTGTSFDEHFNDAFRQLFEMGYEDVVSIGGDVPTMPKEHVKKGFEWLAYFRSIGKPGFVMAPCQECGTSLVGFSSETPGMNHTGIYYNLDGRPALDGYVEKLQESGIPSAYFDPVADIDEVTDLAHAISCMKAIREAARYQTNLYVPNRTLDWVEFMGITISTPPNENHDPRDYLDGEAEAPESDSLGAEAPTPEELQRIAKGMTAIRDATAKTNAYESAKYE